MTELNRFHKMAIAMIEEAFPPGAWRCDLSHPYGIDPLTKDFERKAREIHNRVRSHSAHKIALELTDEESHFYRFVIGECGADLYPDVYLNGMGLYLILVLLHGCKTGVWFDLSTMNRAIEIADRWDSPGVSKPLFSEIQTTLILFVLSFCEMRDGDSKSYPEGFREGVSSVLTHYQEIKLAFEVLAECISRSYQEKVTD